MGNLKARIKATLLRRDSKRLSPKPSKTSFRQDYASNASAKSQPGYDASDERSDRGVRRGSGSLSLDQVINKGINLLVLSNSGKKDDVKNSDGNRVQTPAPDGDGDGDGSARANRPRDSFMSGQTRLQAHGTDGDGDVQADGTDSSTAAPAIRGAGGGGAPGTPAQTPVTATASYSAKPANAKPATEPGPANTCTNDDTAAAPPPPWPQAVATAAATPQPQPQPQPHQPQPQPQPLHCHDSCPDPAALTPATTEANPHATARPGNDLQNLAANSPATIANAPTRVASPTAHTGGGGAGAAGAAAGSAAAPTATIAAVATVATTDPATTTTPGLLPSIHEHPATPPTLPSIHPESGLDITSQEPPTADDAAATATINIEHVHPHDRVANLIHDHLHSPSLLTPPAVSPFRPPLSSPSFSRRLSPPRRQSILPAYQTNIVRALLHGHTHDLELDVADPDLQDPLSGMVVRKIWVKRPLASATLITVNEEDLVDDVREQILRKYANSLGRQYDAPDLTLRICNWEQQTSRPLQPDESIAKVIDSYYANGQTIDDALLIDIPSRRTPKASPNPRFYTDDRPHESGTDYFPPYPPLAHAHHSVAATLVNGQHSIHFPPSMSIVNGAQLPPLPSPGSTRRVPLNRPNLQRVHTASPVSTVANSHASQAAPPSTDQSIHPPAAPPIPTPPPVERTATPPPRVASPRPSVPTKKKRTIEPPTLPLGLLDTAVPPINILIVEDNMINLRLLEAFVKRLKVRWQTAVNGREAVDKWRVGGFHLVLMDIQLPIMNGLEATREIRRIERVNSIGVFSSSASSPPDEVLPEPAEEDKLANTEMFKSPVIIVALTASSLQSDRHEALAAGCNDFLTKPVDFDWLQRKVKEWGCMQALIDFDGWRKWKDFSQKTQASEAAKKTAPAGKARAVKKNRLTMTAGA